MFDHAGHFCFYNRAIAYAQHKLDFVGCKWGGLLCQAHTQAYSICSVYAVRVRYASGAEAALTVPSHRSLQLICGCLLQTQNVSIILISNPNIVIENAFSALWYCFTQSSNTIFHRQVNTINTSKATHYSILFNFAFTSRFIY